MNQAIKQFWNEYAEAFASRFLQNTLLSKFTANTSVTGAYAESWTHSLVKEMLPDYKVSTGCIIFLSVTS